MTEKIPGLPSFKASIYDKNLDWLTPHRFLSDKPTLQDLFNQSYTLVDKIKYKMPIPEEDIKKYAKTNKFAAMVYGIIKNPDDKSRKADLEEDFAGDLTILTSVDMDSPVLNSIFAGDEYLSIYLDDSDFKANWMGVDQDDDWYFDLASDRYYDDRHCEELEMDEIGYIHSYISEKNIFELDRLVELMGKNPLNYDWTQEETIDEVLSEILPKEWETARMVYHRYSRVFRRKK